MRNGFVRFDLNITNSPTPKFHSPEGAKKRTKRESGYAEKLNRRGVRMFDNGPMKRSKARVLSQTYIPRRSVGIRCE